MRWVWGAALVVVGCSSSYGAQGLPDPLTNDGGAEAAPPGDAGVDAPTARTVPASSTPAWTQRTPRRPDRSTASSRSVSRPTRRTASSRAAHGAISRKRDIPSASRAARRWCSSAVTRARRPWCTAHQGPDLRGARQRRPPLRHDRRLHGHSARDHRGAGGYRQWLRLPLPVREVQHRRLDGTAAARLRGHRTRPDRLAQARGHRREGRRAARAHHRRMAS